MCPYSATSPSWAKSYRLSVRFRCASTCSHALLIANISIRYRPSKLLKLEHCDTEDLIEIRLDGQHIEGLSPGQRCSALIPIILLEGDCPLIIDQPEDNLDNKLVFGLVVDIIRGLKEKRQIIVATHNPNIPVSGDAEQIVVFEAGTRERCDSIVQGSIDCPDIVDNVKAIMEGSEEAFRVRATKYGFKFLPVSAACEAEGQAGVWHGRKAIRFAPRSVP